MFLALDIGTTNIKAGVANENGKLLATAIRPNRKHEHSLGYVYYDPQDLWNTISSLINEVVTATAGVGSIHAVGITSMAESGLLVDRLTGVAKTMIIPWFETCAVPLERRIKQEIDPFEQFCQSGLHPSFKQGLSKLLWIQDSQPAALKGSVWLSVSSFVAFLLTGKFAEEETLAARTFVYRVDQRGWNLPLIRHFGLEESHFPTVVTMGTSVGTMLPDIGRGLGLGSGISVCLAGHDHVCASLTIGQPERGNVYNSMGTAETLVGNFGARVLGMDDYQSGLAFGRHPLPDQMFWMGGHSASGGSVEWLRGLIDTGDLSYADILSLLDQVDPSPTGILYYPYLSGCGAPSTNALAKAAWIGLSARHHRGDMFKAILEGNAYQMEWLRLEAEKVGREPINKLVVVGGGAKNKHWLQIKADVSGIELHHPDLPEATLLGAALTAGVGSGVYRSFEEAMCVIPVGRSQVYTHNPDRHKLYRSIFENGFSHLRPMLLDYDMWLSQQIQNEL
ncbi:FGGY family of carbohydrate kinases, C-terminal domain [Paenibacillus sp. yr247]|uniref:FGGY-family carbohydrate kinase n=1 Tax=Paenibacillus sp. yr247 TaxID=1761880 RepID=UPI0008812BC5|nr:FGGY family carbohydrate kinase [Paenibacillus sp. yr247]SDO38896.1 FGGY family of carbohydrate kinases, C-terminal domain [Paenibacillus sp. yr247]